MTLHLIRDVVIWFFIIWLAAQIALAIERPGNPFRLAVRDLIEWIGGK